MTLELFPKHPDMDAYRVGGAYQPYAVVAVDKRFSDAELCAEYQNSRLISYVRQKRTHNYPGDMVLFDHYERGLEQEWLLERFATLPHYDE
ncbi:hypothetical protein ACFC25_04285 [Pseudarthrobacter sp. NPDC055928]|uniref:hypothetical protein n=1 Tax=Pseudarthrobacter sp. NPDC055928 TaxID=3345661 RepID=UPI0035DDEDB6